MSNLNRIAEDRLKEKLKDTLEKLIKNGELPQAEVPLFSVEVPNDRTHGDYSTNIALVSARAFRQNPRKIAELICSSLDLSGTYFILPEVAGAGFINFRLNDSYYADIISDVLRSGENYGRSDKGKGESVMVEFVSANPTGPMHIGNARGGALGDCLAAAFEYAGYSVTREFYINDAGNQIEKFADSLEARYLQLYKGEEIVFPEDGYHGEDIKERALEFANINGDAFVDKDPAARKKALTDYALKKNIEALKNDLERYRIRYDVWFHESLLHHNGEIKETVGLLTQNGLTYEKDGALWYKATAFGSEKDEVLIRSNGNPTYFAADIAYHHNKFQIRGFDRVINIWGADHHGHVARLKGALTAIGADGNRLDVVLMQLVHLMKDGEAVRISKRTGKAITLNTLLDEVPLDAARFFFNMREPNTHLEFDLGLAVEKSSENPVYYVQYAHARICSILKNLKTDGIKPRTLENSELELLKAPEERELIRYIASLENQVLESVRTLDPSKMTKYVIELSTLFHKFYNTCRVKGEDENLMQARIALILSVKTVLVNVLRMLKIDCPESM